MKPSRNSACAVDSKGIRDKVATPPQFGRRQFFMQRRDFYVLELIGGVL